MEGYEKYAAYLKENLTLALGCTEPAAIALAVAGARELMDGEIEQIDLELGINMYKNALYVGIPGIDKKGIEIASALGALNGQTVDGLEIFNFVNEDIIRQAESLKESVTIKVNRCKEGVYINCLLKTSKGESRCIIEGSHTNFTRKEVNGKVVYDHQELYDIKEVDYDYDGFIDHIDQVNLDEFDFIMEGIKKLDEIVEAGLGNQVPLGIGSTLQGFRKNGMLASDVINNTVIKLSAAAEARLSGVQISVMSCGGSGSQGIATVLPIVEMANHMHISKKRMKKAIIVGYATTLYTKKVLGRLSCVCGCAIASSIGATVGIIWMQGGTKEDMQGGINNVVGSLTGVICDGAKVGCAFKMSMGAIMAIYSALLAVDGVYLREDNGIIGSSISETINNMGKISSLGMENMNNVIVNIMEDKKLKK